MPYCYYPFYAARYLLSARRRVAADRARPAQHHLYLDLRGQFEAGYAQGWLRGPQAPGLRVRPGSVSPRPGVALRLRGPGRWSTSLDYAVVVLDCSYVITPPAGTPSSLLRARVGHSFELERLSWLAHYRPGRVHDPTRAVRNLRLIWELLAGAGINYLGRDVEQQRGFSYVVSNQDTVLRARSSFHRAWAPQFTAGLTTRVHWRNRERAFVSVYVAQGLADLLSFETQYGVGGAAITQGQLRARGSAFGFTLGLYSWPARS
ncbi:hypothetical protein LJ737_14085 [Hymenobacter sp. 15J16-1T3B]|uniref:hypothetical protein n=1 Tax=Hymenobacter sp. 15J16-1T3B TaxID=2886941 RepID=UPI001D11DEDB|nr:hypothetical protein [Hymenobacter sp. 15J16-1T3B]MCC3158374.1 hypothetical protein [Hymenobacter sp. 15J16-1T3B]